VSTEDPKVYLNIINKDLKSSKKLRLLEDVSGTPRPLQEILAQLLQFNPYHRATASELLKNPLFDEIRKQSLEEGCKSKL